MNNGPRRRLANLLRELTHHLDPVPPSPVYPQPGDRITVVFLHLDGSKTWVRGIVNVTQGTIDGPTLTYLVLREEEL